jgi:asparagine synthase (glutamine-hydrolysing)
MCGIYGIIHLDGQPVAPELIDAMGMVTLHRGPDDEGRHHDGPCVLGMRRLSIIDLSGGHQPLSNVEKSLWLVCNGEIYNFRELRRELEAKGHHFLTGSDSECVIHAYAEWGDEFITRLNGMFGFALWDAKLRRLIVGRDRLGIKPIYYHSDARRLVFATEAKAILTLPGFPIRVDPVALESYLQLGYVAAPQSMFEGIRKLPPATLMIVENGRVQQRTYWAIPEATDRGMREDQWAEQVREGMERSVAAQMVSDVPIGAFLSGGIDSSAVVGFMAKHSSQPIRTYSIGFGGSSADNFYNELPYAKRVAELFGTQHHEIVVRPDVASLLPKLLWHMDEPIADTAFVTTYLVSQFARQEVKVILSGVGGDELFGGYRRYLGSHYLARFDRLPGWVRKSALRASELLPSDRHSGMLNAMRLAKGFLASAELSFEERYRAYVQVFRTEQAARLMRVAPSRRVDPIGAAFSQAGGDDQLNRMFAVDGATQLPDDLLMLTDKMSMAVSLECRVPLLDHQLVELAARMPESIKIRGGELKYAMKKSLEGLLPLDILHRKKRGFGTPMGAWLKGDLARLLDHVLSERSVVRRGLFNHPAIDELIRAHRGNREDYTDQLLSLMNMELWARIYLDRRPPQDVADELKEAVV